jgi:hypothetical protein
LEVFPPPRFLKEYKKVISNEVGNKTVTC